MKHSQDENIKIANRLDYINEYLYNSQKAKSRDREWQDLYWCYNTIKELQLKIYKLKNFKKCNCEE